MQQWRVKLLLNLLLIVVKMTKLKITRLAQGMPIGGELDTLDYNTLSTAFDSRSEMKANH